MIRWGDEDRETCMILIGIESGLRVDGGLWGTVGRKEGAEGLW